MASLAVLFIGSAVIGEGRRIAGFMLQRHHLALLLAAVLVVLGCVPLTRVPLYIEPDVLGLVYLMSIVTGYMEVSGVAELVASRVSRLSGRKAIFAIIMAAGALSLILENVSVVYLFAPLALRVAQMLSVDPTVTVVGVALASDMSGSATMVGDPPAIITAGYLNLNFMDFIVYHGRPSMFFYTVVAMVAATSVITMLYVRSVKPRGRAGIEAVKSVIDKVFLLEVIVFVAIKIFLLSIRDAIHVPLTLAALAAVAGITLTRLLVHHDTWSVREAFSKHDIETPLFLAGVFVISGAFVETGLASRTAELILGLSHGNVLLLSLILIVVSMIASAVIYNTPYVAAMLPVVKALALKTHTDPVILAWALLIGATLGGTLTYIGAMGNYAAVRYLSSRGYPVNFRKFARISIPFTLVSVVVGAGLYILSFYVH